MYKSYQQKDHEILSKENGVELTEEEKELAERKTNPLFKQVFPLLDSHGNKIPRSEAAIKNNDVISVRLKFKKKDKPTPGLGFKLISLQLVRQYDVNNKRNANCLDEEPIDFGDFGTKYKRMKSICSHDQMIEN